MFFSNAKGHAQDDLSREQAEYRNQYQDVLASADTLLDIRCDAVRLLHECEAYLQMISNRPYEYDLKSSRLNKEYQELEKQLKKYKYKSSKSKAVRLFRTGAVTGTGIAVLGPNVALAAATTFGTASTGAAISSLGGAAATNAALAWLGGGALAAGGAGIAGGQALLALAGPIGIAVGAGCAVAAGLLAVDNKKKAQQAEIDTAAIKNEITRLRGVKKQVDTLQTETISLSQLVENELNELKALKKQDYSSFSSGEARKLGTMMNNAQSLASKITEVIPMN